MGAKLKYVVSPKKFNKLKKEKGVTSYRISKETGIPRTVLYDFCREVSGLSVSNLFLLADYFGCDARDLLVRKRV